MKWKLMIFSTYLHKEIIHNNITQLDKQLQFSQKSPTHCEITRACIVKKQPVNVIVQRPQFPYY